MRNHDFVDCRNGDIASGQTRFIRCFPRNSTRGILPAVNYSLRVEFLEGIAGKTSGVGYFSLQVRHVALLYG